MNFTHLVKGVGNPVGNGCGAFPQRAVSWSVSDVWERIAWISLVLDACARVRVSFVCCSLQSRYRCVFCVVLSPGFLLCRDGVGYGFDGFRVGCGFHRFRVGYGFEEFRLGYEFDGIRAGYILT